MGSCSHNRIFYAIKLMITIIPDEGKWSMLNGRTEMFITQPCSLCFNFMKHLKTKQLEQVKSDKCCLLTTQKCITPIFTLNTYDE